MHLSIVHANVSDGAMDEILRSRGTLYLFMYIKCHHYITFEKKENLNKEIFLQCLFIFVSHEFNQLQYKILHWYVKEKTTRNKK